MRTRNAIEDKIQTNQCWQCWKILETNYRTIIKCKHLQESIALKLLPYFSSEIASKANRYDIDYIH